MLPRNYSAKNIAKSSIEYLKSQLSFELSMMGLAKDDEDRAASNLNKTVIFRKETQKCIKLLKQEIRKRNNG